MMRLSDVAKGCTNLAERVADNAVSETSCEDLDRLEHYHDVLAKEVRNLACLVAELALAKASPDNVGVER